MTEVILGLDLSVSCSGWALLSLREDRVIAYGKVVTVLPKKKDRPADIYFKRVQKVVDVIDEVFARKDVQIVAVGVEQLNYFRGIDTARDLLGVSKVVQHHIWKAYGLMPNEINTTTAKKAFTGRGDALKTLVLVIANTHFKLSPPLIWVEPEKDKNHTSDDGISDAISIAWTLRLEIKDRLTKAIDNSAAKA